MIPKMVTWPDKKSIVQFALVMALIIILDFITKIIMLDLIFNPPRVIALLPILNLAPVWNEGISFGLFQDGGIFIRLGISALAVAVVIWLFFQLPTLPKWQKLAAAFISGGAIGNVIDRIIYGKVVDFVDFHLGNWHYPAFNIADSAIFIGVILWIITLWWDAKKAQPQKDEKG